MTICVFEKLKVVNLYKVNEVLSTYNVQKMLNLYYPSGAAIMLEGEDVGVQLTYIILFFFFFSSDLDLNLIFWVINFK